MANNAQQNSGKEPHATVGDALAAGVIILAIVAIICGINKTKPTPATQKQATIWKLDSLVQDSLSKTIEYQNAVRATQELEAKRADIRNYFSTRVIKY